MWLQPRDGTPAPGESPEDNDVEKAALVVGAIALAGPPTPRHEGTTWRYDLIELRIRATKAPAAIELSDTIRLLVNDRRNYDLAPVDGAGNAKRVIESLTIRELAPLGSGPQGYTFGIQHLFQTYLTDQPE